MNKFNFYRLEHKEIKIWDDMPPKVGPYAYYWMFRENISYSYARILSDREDSPLFKTNKFYNKNPPPSSFLIKRPGPFEDPHLRVHFLPLHLSGQMSKNFVFGFTSCDSLMEWFDFDQGEMRLMNDYSFVISRYKVDNIIHGLRQAVAYVNQNMILEKQIGL